MAVAVAVAVAVAYSTLPRYGFIIPLCAHEYTDVLIIKQRSGAHQQYGSSLQHGQQRVSNSMYSTSTFGAGESVSIPLTVLHSLNQQLRTNTTDVSLLKTEVSQLRAEVAAVKAEAAEAKAEAAEAKEEAGKAREDAKLTERAGVDKVSSNKQGLSNSTPRDTAVEVRTSYLICHL